MPLIGGGGYTVDSQITLQWLAADPFAVMVTCEMVDLVVEFFTDVQLLHYVVAEHRGVLSGTTPGQPVQLRYSPGLFGAKVELADRIVFFTAVGEHAHAIGNYVRKVNDAFALEHAAIAANVDHELAGLFHTEGDDESAA